MRCVLLIFRIVLHIKNVVISAIRNFLDAFEVSEPIKNSTGMLSTQKILGALELDIIQILTGVVFAAPFFSTYRTDLIQNALCSPDLGEVFRYPERSYKCHRKFFPPTTLPEK